jgi:hypothetical protein
LHEEEKALFPHSSVYAYDTIAKCLSKSEIRLVFATMLREGSQVLTLSAGEGKWRPDLRALSTQLTLWRLEMILALPSPFWDLFCLILQFPSPPLPSPDTVDRLHLRESCGIHQIEELLNSSMKQKKELKILSYLHSKLTEQPHYQQQQQQQQQQQGRGTGSSNDVLKELKELMGTSESFAEVMYWLVRALGVISVLIVFYFLILH